MAQCFVLACAIVPFVVVLGHGFAYDDHWTIETNDFLLRPIGSLVRTLLHGDGTRLGLPDASRPLMVLSTALDRRIFGDRAWGFHLVSLLLHGAASVLSYRLAAVLTRSRSQALVAATFFALAPIHSEVIASVNYREDLLATIGLFASLATFLAPAARPHDWERAAVVAAWLAFALLAKESAVVAPLLTIALGAVLGIGGRGLIARERSITLVVCVLAVYGTFRYAISLGDDGVARAEPAAFGELCLDTGRYLTFVIASSLAPIRSTPFFAPMMRASPWGFLLPIVAIGVAIASLRTTRHRTLGIGVIVVLIAPLASGPFTRAANEFADRYVYASVLGGGLVSAWAWDRARTRVPAAWVRAFALAMALVFAGLGARDASAWHDDLRLFRRSVALAPESARAHVALAWALRMEGRLDEAERELDAAERLHPGSDRVALGRGMIAAARGEPARARLIAYALARRSGPVSGLAGLLRCASVPPEQAVICGRSLRFP